jgi:hypothetical protein
MKNFILNYVDENAKGWRTAPEIIAGSDFQDCLLLVFGIPKVAAFAHMDTTGFTARYQDQLIPIGGPEISGDEVVWGYDSLGEIECHLRLDDEGHLFYDFGRGIDSGTSLVFKPEFHNNKSTIVSPYMDNRVGIYNLLKLAEELENGVLVFSCWEEHGGGTVPFLVKYLYETYKIQRMLISDVTWATDGVHLNEGVAISLRDRSIPRKSIVTQIIDLAKQHRINYQLEVEAYGSSDGREIQASPYPIDWCFIGPPVEHVHSNREKISKSDLESMMNFYRLLMQKL